MVTIRNDEKEEMEEKNGGKISAKELVSWWFESCQLQRVISGQKTSIRLSPSILSKDHKTAEVLKGNGAESNNSRSVLLVFFFFIYTHKY